jgi:AcrR family transcriptional regulator
MPLTQRAAVSGADGPSRQTAAAACSAAERINEALAALRRSGLGGEPPDRATVAELCRRACVSRNTLYRYYPDVLEALRRLHRQQQRTTPVEASAASRDLRPELKSLQAQLNKLAALVDHYYAAYRETQTLLESRDREIAELRRRLKSSPTQLRR